MLHIPAASPQKQSLSLKEFGDLVSSALDMQSVSENALGFSITTTTRSRSPSVEHHGDSTIRGPKLSPVKTAITSQRASPEPMTPNTPTNIDATTRRLASSSVPALNDPIEIQCQDLRRVRPAASFATFDDKLRAKRAPIRPSTATPTPSSPGTPLTPTGSMTFRLPSFVPSWGRSKKDKTPSRLKTSDLLYAEHPSQETLNSVSRSRTKSSPMAFLNLPLPLLKKKSSKLLFTSERSPSPDPVKRPGTSASRASPTKEISREASEEPRSFFDDSGYEDEIKSRKTLKTKKTRPTLKSLFSSSAFSNSSSRAQSRGENRAPLGSKKDLPAIPLADDRSQRAQSPLQSIPIPQGTLSRRDQNVKRQGSLNDFSSLFYVPTLPVQPVPVSTIDEVQRSIPSPVSDHSHVHPEWTTRSSNPTPHKAKYKIKNSPPPYPSPSYPLPPTPALFPIALPTVSPPNSDHLHLRDLERDDRSGYGSVDSMEILSWRAHGAVPRTSNDSSGSSGHAHARGLPSKGSIRDRLGLGPRLRLNVSHPLPNNTQTSARPKSRTVSSNPFRRSRTLSRLTLRPASSIFSSSPKNSVVKLASTSLVSLKSSLTVSGPEAKEGGNELQVDRVLTPEDDPFAGPPPPTPTTPLMQFHVGPQTSRPHTPGSGANENASPTTPDSAPAVLVHWKGARAPVESQVKLPSPTVHTPPASAGAPSTSSKFLDTPSSDRSGLPPSLIDELEGKKRRAGLPSTPVSPSTGPASRRNQLNLHGMLSRARGNQMQRSMSKASRSKMSNNSAISTISTSGSQTHLRVQGHTDSRPNSPFPLLFGRGNTKVAPGQMRSSVLSVSDLEAHVEECESNGSHHSKALAILTSSSKIATSTPDITISVSADQPIVEHERNIPTASSWYDDDEDEEAESEGDAAKNKLRSHWSTDTNELGLQLNSDVELPSASVVIENGDVGASDASAINRASLLLLPHSGFWDEKDGPSGTSTPKLQPQSSSSVVDTDTETLADGRRESKDGSSWPLPPLRTLVLDGETGESWHDVEPVVEYAPTQGEIPENMRSRLSVRVPKSSSASGSASNCSHSSGSSSHGSPNSRILSTHQARVIAEKLGFSSSRRSSARYSLLPSPSSSRQHHGRERSRSNASLASQASGATGTRSYRTAKSALYTTRSSGSFRSHKSSSSSSQNHSNNSVSRSGSSCSGLSVHRSTSIRNSRSFAPTSFTMGRQPRARTSTSTTNSMMSGSDNSLQVRLANRRMNPDAIPQRVVLRDEAPANTFMITTDGWPRLMAFCAQNDTLTFEAEAEKSDASLCISLEEVRRPSSSLGRRQGMSWQDPEFYEPQMPGGLPSSFYLTLSMTLGTGRQDEVKSREGTRAPVLSFNMPLPVKLGEIAEHSRSCSLGEGLKSISQS